MPPVIENTTAQGGISIVARSVIRDENHTELTCLELFAGPGGLALGTHQAGFKHLGLIEFEATAATTLRENCKGPLNLDPGIVIEKDAREVDYAPFVGKVDLLAAGPPCQPFSLGGHGKGPDDNRNMFPILLDVIGIIAPRAVLIENVQGLIRPKFRSYFDYILKRIQFPLHKPDEGEKWQEHYCRLLKVKRSDFPLDAQNQVWHQVVDAADHGIPQRRHRVFIIALRCDLCIAPFSLDSTHSRVALLDAQWVTGAYWVRHGIDPVDEADIRDTKTVRALQASMSVIGNKEPWRTVRDAISSLPPPVARGEEETFANHVQHPGARVYPGHHGSRLDFPSKALKAGGHGTPGGENIVRLGNGQVRYFTVREAARLQTFPDTWQFMGRWGNCIKQLGNAVPVSLANQFARILHDCLTNISKESETQQAQTESDTLAKDAILASAVSS